MCLFVNSDNIHMYAYLLEFYSFITVYVNDYESLGIYAYTLIIENSL